MDEAIDRIVSELESLRAADDPDSLSQVSESTLRDFQTIVEDGQGPEALLSEMSRRNSPHSSLVQMLSRLMDSVDPNFALAAADVYLSILVSANSPLYSLFTPVGFLSLLQSLRRSFKRHVSEALPPCNSEAPTGTRSRKRKGRAHNKQVGCRGEGQGSGTFQLNSIDLVLIILEKLDVFLRKIQLLRFPDSLKSVIETTVELLAMGTQIQENPASFQKFCHSCFRLMESVLNPDHGDQTLTATEVLKSLSRTILLLKSQVQTFALRFVTHRMMAISKESDAVKKAVIYFPRYLIGKAPEKSEARASAVESIMEIVKAMEFDDRIQFADYVVKMTKGKAQLRLLAVDLIAMLMMSLPDPLMQGNASWGLKCLEGLLGRCSDVNAGIRARALSNLANLLDFLSSIESNQLWLREVLGLRNGKLNNLLRRRCKDTKAAVRKAALSLIMKSITLISTGVDQDMLKLIGVACADPLVSIRKAALLALSEIFRKFSDREVVAEWLRAVPRLISDNESSVQEECEGLFQELVLDRVARVGCAAEINTTYKASPTDPNLGPEVELESVFTEGVLTILNGLCDGEVAPCVKKICRSIGKKKRFKPRLSTALQNIISASESLWLRYSRPVEKWTAPPGAWFLLSEVSTFLPKAVGWKFLQHHWKLFDRTDPKTQVEKPLIQETTVGDVDGNESTSVNWAADRVFLLQTISNVSLELPPEPAADLAQSLLRRIERFNMHPTEVNAHARALRTLCKQKAAISEEGDALVSKCVQQLLSKSVEILNTFLSEITESGRNTFKTPPLCNSKKGKRRAGKSTSLSRAVTAVFTIGSLVLICPSADFKDIIPILHTIITSGCSQPKPKELASLAVSVKHVAPSLYIQSWLTMGKICLADGKLAKRYIPLYVQELEKSDCAALRNNIVVLMADFCVRYTALVDCYIPKITNSLRDPCEIVRRQTFILLSRLLQRDYVKWRGVLFLRFLVALVDESEKIRKLADFLFGNILKVKAPLLAYNSFIEAIFVLNDCHAHTRWSESQSKRNSDRLFSIRGNDEKSRSQRMHIYVTLLKQMAPEHLLATSAKLCAEILAAASDSLLDLNDVAAQSVLQDALQILASKEMRIQPSRGPASADVGDIDVDGGDSGGALAAANGKLITLAAKRNLIQNAVPIFIELKRLLESKNSPLTGCLMECLRVLLKDYKNEIDEILVADPQLRKEILYDMQKYEAVKARTMAQEAAASIQRSAGHVTPPTHNNIAATRATKVGNGSKENTITMENMETATKLASAVADVVAEGRAKSVLKEVNRNNMASPPLSSMSLPKLKSSNPVSTGGTRSREVLESLRRRQSFDSDLE